jgi:hypothetical protein
MVRDRMIGIQTQRMAEIMPEILNDTFGIHAQRRLFDFNRQRVLNNKRLGMNDDSPMIQDINILGSRELYQSASLTAPDKHNLYLLQAA